MSSLVPYSRFDLVAPSDLAGSQLASFLGLAARAAAARRTALIVGVTVDRDSQAVWLEIERRIETQVLAMLQTSLPGVRIKPADPLGKPFTLVGAVRVSTNRRPLGADSSVAAGLIALGRSLRRGERVQWQLTLSGARSPRPVHAGERPEDPTRVVKTIFGVPNDPFIRDGRDRSDLVAKQKRPLLNALGTLAVRTAVVERDRAVMSQALAALRTAESPGVRLRLRTSWQRTRRSAFERRRLPLFEWPLQLNLDEAVALLGWPTADSTTSSAGVGHARWLTTAEQPDLPGIAVATTHDARGTHSPLLLPDVARTKHLQVIGPTGVGKSTLLTHAVVQDIAAGRAVVVLDPKRDLIDAILQRVPTDQLDRVIVFDPSTPGAKLALNPLQGGTPEQVTDFLVHLMRGLFARSWGPRTEDVLRTGLLTLALSGSYTMVDLPRLLSDQAFRNQVQAAMPPHPLLIEYWRWFEALSDGHRAEITAPLLSRLRSLLLAGPLHDILSVKDPKFDLDIVFRKRQVVLVPLSAGQLGEDAAGLLGSLIMARLWQLTQQRTFLPEKSRHPVMLYLDEFHQYLHLPTSMAETLAQARGLGLALTLAHQHLDQLTTEVRAAVLANARNRITFQLPARDAGVMANDMAPLDASDFKNLASFEIYLRTMNESSVLRPASGYTNPLKPGDPKLAANIRNASLKRYGDAVQSASQQPKQKQSSLTDSMTTTAPRKAPPIGFRLDGSEDHSTDSDDAGGPK